MLCTAETDAYCTKSACNLCIVWSISICADNELGIFVAEIHEFSEVARDLSSLSLYLTEENLTC